MTSVPLLVVIGAPGAGKTRVGKRVARLLDADFIDTDRRIVAAHGPVSEIFASHGEAYFRDVEHAVVVEALREHAVVSLGGGAVIDSRSRAQLEGKRIALLTVSAEAVGARIGGEKRPLLAEGSTEERVAAWQRLVEARRDVYEALATRTWDTSTRPIDLIAREIADWVEHDTAGMKQL